MNAIEQQVCKKDFIAYTDKYKNDSNTIEFFIASLLLQK